VLAYIFGSRVRLLRGKYLLEKRLPNSWAGVASSLTVTCRNRELRAEAAHVTVSEGFVIGVRRLMTSQGALLLVCVD